MPKMKTRSSAKKRFRLNAAGKVKMGPACKRHGMTKRPQKMIQTARGATIMKEMDAKVVKKYMLPNG
ncbi:MAG: 50S ribosomal protein L35 [Alphaproteobacteria bacterium 16-39-46]|nr:50S ribosomal protein L35 [Pseudomonadota bacterium]OYZ36604.1 MAG: 50S ribosomal protein L35 [Alphaproteobacteria bacterium 16-39-46]OZA42147.1 MAG: 50S ribosomal protein L35 [Alphaproteobacteria bacterium 17-39-52]HQS84629.1 50S ribosomal protein L35 [Alphaproteobacteria bacterium]HQS94441.1 50S ribosomal protein L35 [Alphaproteobacteria bacterium]